MSLSGQVEVRVDLLAVADRDLIGVPPCCWPPAGPVVSSETMPEGAYTY